MKRPTMDALKWAEYFMQTMKENDWEILDIDESLMVGWFANAIMDCYDIQQQRIKELEEEVKRAHKLTAIGAVANKKLTEERDDYRRLLELIVSRERGVCPVTVAGVAGMAEAVLTRTARGG